MRTAGEMRRLISLLAAIALVAGPLATAGSAVGGDRHEGRGEQGRGDQGRGGGMRGEGRWPGGGVRAAPPPQVYRGGGEYRGEGRYERVDPRSDPRGMMRGDPRGDPRGEYRYERVDPRYDPRAYGPPPSYSGPTRRGGYLGPDSDGGPVQDYARQHLRPPPRGYEWVRTPSGMALVSQSTHQVFDVVPY